ncbi:MAG: DNA-processing protein DprA [Lachnospiraceae bacterium]
MELNIWYFLTRLPGIGDAKIKKLLERFPDPTDILRADKSELAQCKALSEKDLETILLYRRNSDKIRQDFSLLEKENIRFVGRTEEDFPRELLYCQDPPMGLFVKGRFAPDGKRKLAIVGARMCSPYGKSITRQIAGMLADCGAIIVSGMARGIDGLAHEEALDHGGITYAVLAGGVDVVYPPEHRKLYERILEQGALISEYPPGTKPSKGMFPRRNRLISGLSEAVILTEARKRSGSLITADLALEQGKDIYVVPGRLDDPLSEGCNAYIRQGAQIITSIPELIYDLQLSPGKKYGQIEKQNFSLEKEESLVYSCLRLTPKGLDEITLESGLGLMKVYEIISKLRDLGLIEECYINQYIRSR